MNEEKKQRQNNLPEGWVWATIGRITNPSKERVKPTEINTVPYIGLEHIEAETGYLLNHGYSNEVKSIKSVFYEGNLLYGKLRPYLNKVIVAPFDGVCSTDILVYPLKTYFENKFLKYRLLAADFVQYAQKNVSGVQHPRVNDKTLARFEIGFPPLPEQKRIVGKIEELFTQLDAGVAALKRAQANLKRYKASVLKAACEGRLVPTEARLHPDVYEPASVLLERILKERHAKWEADLIAEGKDPSKRKYKEPAQPDVENLPELPEGWVWATVEHISHSMKNGIYKKKEFYSDDGIACLRMYNIEDGEIKWFDIKRMVLTDGELAKYSLVPGEILVNRVNSRELVGKSAVIPDNIEQPLVFESKNIRLKLFNTYVESLFVNYWFRAYAHQYFNFHAQQVVGMASINQGQLGSMAIPLAPLYEQRRIIKRVERKLSVIKEIECEIETDLTRAERLRQAILKRAFAGRLVPQNPNDEPASVLLERVKGEREEVSK